jgi:hypothetical protein
MQVNDMGEMSDESTLSFVVDLYNAFNDTTAVYDSDKHESLARFMPGGTWTTDSGDIEAICHLIVATASSLHTYGVTSLAHRRLPDKVPEAGSRDALLTFAQRIWCLVTLVRHYKAHADTLMQMLYVDEYLVNAFSILFEAKDFNIHFNARPKNETDTWIANFQRRGMPHALQPAADPDAGFQVVQGIERPQASQYTIISGADPHFADDIARPVGRKVEGLKRPTSGSLSMTAATSAPSKLLQQFQELSNTALPMQAAVNSSPRSALNAIIMDRVVHTRDSLRLPLRSQFGNPVHGLLEPEAHFDASQDFNVNHWNNPGANTYNFDNMDLGGVPDGQQIRYQTPEDNGNIQLGQFEFVGEDIL